MRGVWAALCAAGAVLAAGAAQAATITLTFNGTVSGGIDDLGVFGAAGADLTGSAFQATFQFGDPSSSIGKHVASGGATLGLPDPGLGGSITIGGVTLTLPAFTDLETFQGSDVSFVGSQTVGIGIADVEEFGPAGSVVFNLREFAPSLVGSTLTISGTDTPNTLAAQGSLFLDGMSQNLAFSIASGTVSPITGVANAIPEPSTWTLIVAGFGGAGAMLRRRRAAAAA